MSDTKLRECPLCGGELQTHGPEDWKPTFNDPDSGGNPYTAYCTCGYSFDSNTYDYAEFLEKANTRAEATARPDNNIESMAF